MDMILFGLFLGRLHCLRHVRGKGEFDFSFHFQGLFNSTHSSSIASPEATFPQALLESWNQYFNSVSQSL